MGYPVVLLDESDAKPALVADDSEQIIEVGVFMNEHYCSRYGRVSRGHSRLDACLGVLRSEALSHPL